jgi:hypothetical protein
MEHFGFIGIGHRNPYKVTAEMASGYNSIQEKDLEKRTSWSSAMFVLAT